MENEFNNENTNCGFLGDVKNSNSPFSKITQWANGLWGHVTDIHHNCVYRFIPCTYDSSTSDIQYQVDPSEYDNCSIVAVGIVAYWLGHRDYSTSELFNSYLNNCFQEYENAHRKDIDAWDRDFQKEFITARHYVMELDLISQSAAFFPYLHENDCKQIRLLTKNYLLFVRAKSKELYPPQYTPGHELEESFIQSFYHASSKCQFLIADKYHIDNDGCQDYSAFHFSNQEYTAGLEMIQEQLSQIRIPHVFFGSSSLYAEIEENISKMESWESKKRYVIYLINEFKSFASFVAILPQYSNVGRYLYTMVGKCQMMREKTNTIEGCLYRLSELMNYFALRLASITLVHQLDFLALQEECQFSIFDKLEPSDYVDNCRIVNENQAIQFLNILKGTNSPKDEKRNKDTPYDLACRYPKIRENVFYQLGNWANQEAILKAGALAIKMTPANIAILYKVSKKENLIKSKTTIPDFYRLLIVMTLVENLETQKFDNQVRGIRKKCKTLDDYPSHWSKQKDRLLAETISYAFNQTKNKS